MALLPAMRMPATYVGPVGRRRLRAAVTSRPLGYLGASRLIAVWNANSSGHTGMLICWPAAHSGGGWRGTLGHD
jgi:hypothetical protein